MYCTLCVTYYIVKDVLYVIYLVHYSWQSQAPGSRSSHVILPPLEELFSVSRPADVRKLNGNCRAALKGSKGI